MPGKKIIRKGTFKWDRIISITSLLLTLLIFLISIGTNRKLELFKSQNAIVSNYSKVQIDKLAELWGELNVFEAKIFELTLLIKKYQFNKVDTTTFAARKDAARFDELKKSINFEEILYLAERNRFWINEEQYNLLGDWSLQVVRKLEIYSYLSSDSIIAKSDSLIILDKLISEKRQKLDAVLMSTLYNDNKKIKGLRKN